MTSQGSNNRHPLSFKILPTTAAAMPVVLAIVLIMLLNPLAKAQTAGDFDMTVDALANCITLYELEQHNFTTTRHPIPTGYYEVTVDSNAYYYWGIQVKKVEIYVTTDDDPYGWFFTVSQGTPTYVHVTGVGAFPNEVRGFFIDIGCGDNTGSAIVHFHRIH